MSKDIITYHDPGDENDNEDITMAEAAEMTPENIAKRMKQHNERNKLREEIEEVDAEQE